MGLPGEAAVDIPAILFIDRVRFRFEYSTANY
jgi:hypothetical protein